MTAIHVLWPGDPATPTGGFAYDRRIVQGLRTLGRTVVDHVLPDGFPDPDPTAQTAAAEALAGIPDGALAVVDGLALGVLPHLAQRHGTRLRLIGLVHHPLAEETGLAATDRARLFASERAALATVARVIVTSRATAAALAAYDVAAGMIAVVEPGTDPVPPAIGSGSETMALLCAATLTPRKGHAVLLRALAGLTRLPWRLTCAGDDRRDPETTLAVRRLLTETGLADRVTLTGALPADDLAALYHRADLFVLASHYEGYGMVLAEALARGLPIVSTTAGAIPATVPAEAGVLVPPGDVDALAAALERLLTDAALRRRLRRAALDAAARLPSWADSAGRFAYEIEKATEP